MPSNPIYDLLFCDDLASFEPPSGAELASWQILLFGSEQECGPVIELANRLDVESRVRALAYRWLQARGAEVPRDIVLGVVIEVPLDGGLDVLAAYADGSVRYINQTGKLVVIEPGGLDEANILAKQIVRRAEPVVKKIDPWDKPRLAPPAKPAVRLTFVVSDGLYFGQGPFHLMQQDPLAGPILAAGAQLVSVVTREALARQAN